MDHPEKESLCKEKRTLLRNSVDEGLFFGSRAYGLVISNSYGRVKPPPSLFPASNEAEPGGPPFHNCMK
jgi:hypothetical protein